MAKIIPNQNSFIGFTVSPVGSLPTPAAPTAVAATTGGTLPAGTQAYKVTALGSTGETDASAEVTQATTGATSTVTVSWTAVPGATGYRVYGRASGTEGLLAQTIASVTTFTDTGALTPGSPPPSSNSASNLSAPKVADVVNAVDLTPLTISLNASAQGNTVPTPALDSLFETTIPGTSQASFSGDFYRDDVFDNAWLVLPRGTKGTFIIARYGGKPAAAGKKCEVWPVQVTSRSMSNMASNTAETFTVTCSVPVEPAENALVAA
jgi:hypothetical protein